MLLPWQLGSASLYPLQRVVQLATLGLVLPIGGLVLLRAFEPARLLRLPARLRWTLSVAAVLMAAALVLAPHAGVALLELGYLMLLSVAGSLLAASSNNLPRLAWAALGGLLTLFLLLYSVFAADHLHLVWPFANRHDFGPGFANVRFFADVAVGVMPLALLYAVARRRPSAVAAFLCVIPLTFWWWLLWVSESRAALLGLIAGAAVALFLFGRAARWPLTMLAISGALGLVGWWFLNPIGGGGSGAEQAFVRDITSSSGRLDLWRDALRYSLGHFPLGIGPMGFAGDGNLRSAHAHNFFLNTAAEWGLPLALLLLALLLYGCWVIVRRARAMPEGDKPIYACLVIAFVGVVVNAQFAGSHIIPLSSLVLVLSIGLVFGYRPSNEAPPPIPVGPVPLRATLIWAALMLLYAYLLYAGLELYWLAEDSTATCFQEQGRAYYYPRFWAQGRLECMQMVDPDHWLFWSWRDWRQG
ncbi:O-antigen ligase family protein [Halomonas sp. H10-9-1]|uniref:O-antigen ligase family protein n=1 Tax=Halomonas sp. H10-9-1 TaxID=2950871 RepID=UPI0032DE9CD1